jgi:hypothetical protein
MGLEGEVRRPGSAAAGTWRSPRRDIDAWAAALVKQKNGDKK